MLAGLVLGAAALSAAAAPLARDFSATRPVNWVSVAAGQPSQVWVETAAGGSLSSDGGRSFRAPLSTSAFQRAQIAQATLLADGKTLIAMPTVWSAQQFTLAALVERRRRRRGTPAHSRAPTRTTSSADAPGFVGESPVTADPTDPRTAWFCQGNLYATHDAGRTWAVATPRFKRPWHCAALAIASGKQHTLILLVQSKAKNSKRVPGKLLRSVDGGATWKQLKAPRYPQLDYNSPRSRSIRSQPSAALMIAANGAKIGVALPLHRRGSLVEARAPGGHAARRRRRRVRVRERRARARARAHRRPPARAVRVAGRRRDTGTSRPTLEFGAKSPAVYPSPLAASGTSFLLGTNQRGFWRLAPEAQRWAGP